MSLRHYETVFIITPILPEQQVKETVEKFESLLKEKGAKVYHSESWGLRKLAYPIDKKTTGVYQLFEFNASPELISSLEVELKRDERVLRFMTVSLDKYAVEFNQKRREGSFKKKQTKEEVAS
jgi:small subunit ribosomal protein S6